MRAGFSAELAICGLKHVAIKRSQANEDLPDVPATCACKSWCLGVKIPRTVLNVQPEPGAFYDFLSSTRDPLLLIGGGQVDGKYRALAGRTLHRDMAAH